MTYKALKTILIDSGALTAAQATAVANGCGEATIGNAIVVCFLIEKELGISLSGNDVDAIIATAAQK